MTKRIYNHPEVQVARISLAATILIGSEVPTLSVIVNTGIPANGRRIKDEGAEQECFAPFVCRLAVGGTAKNGTMTYVMVTRW